MTHPLLGTLPGGMGAFLVAKDICAETHTNPRIGLNVRVEAQNLLIRDERGLVLPAGKLQSCVRQQRRKVVWLSLQQPLN